MKRKVSVYKQYKTEYSNQVHQLIVSVSKHFYVTSNGKYKQQKKAFEVKLDKPETFTKKHVVHYLIRDHFSGLFYAEVTETENILPVSEFLYRAWSRKKYHPLYGVPWGVTVPKTVKSKWPKLSPFLDETGIIPLDVTSGFQGGVRDIRTWEEYLRCDLYESGHPPEYSEVLKRSADTCKMLNISTTRGKSKEVVWKEGLTSEVYLPSSPEAFVL